MPIFVVVAHKGPEAVGTAIAKTFPEQFYHLPPSAWFVSDKGTVVEVSSKLGLQDGTLGAQGVVLPVTTWAGWAPSDLWEWLKSRLEVKPIG